jgi:hypothetical protein
MLVAPGIILIYTYTLVNLPENELSADEAAEMHSAIESELIDKIRRSSDMKELRENGVTFRYVYRASNFEEVFALTIPPEMYEQDL